MKLFAYALYAPMRNKHLHGISKPVFPCLRASVPDMKSTPINVITEWSILGMVVSYWAGTKLGR